MTKRTPSQAKNSNRIDQVRTIFRISVSGPEFPNFPVSLSLSQSPDNSIYRTPACSTTEQAGSFFVYPRYYRLSEAFIVRHIMPPYSSSVSLEIIVALAAKNCILVQNVCPLFWILSGYLFVKCASRQARVSFFILRGDHIFDTQGKMIK